MIYKTQNGLSLRHIDDNGYMLVDKSPILKAGILEYFGSELLPEGSDTVDGVRVDKDKIYKVYIPLEEIEKAKDTFKLLPIVDGHTWLGDEGEDPKDYQEGSTGENVFIENNMLYVPLKITGKNMIDEIESGNKEELSSSYYNRFVKSDDSEYDFIARDIKGNHLALVDKGRCGSAVRVLNSNIKGAENMALKSKSKNEAILELDGKRINLDQFFDEEKQEKEGEEAIHEDSITENEDKREIIREIMAIAGKANTDFDGGEEEKVETIAKLAEKLAYKPSEDSETDNEDTLEEDKEEILEEKEEDVKVANYDAMFAKISNAVKAERDRQEAALVKAYNSVRAVIGDFNPFGMSEKAMYSKALNHLGVSLDGKETVKEMSAMLKACSSIHSKVDNGFNYSDVSSEEIELNI